MARTLIAKTRLLYGGRRREIGSTFSASEAHARMLVKAGRADYADGSRPRVELPPIPETLRNRAMAGRAPDVPARQVVAMATQPAADAEITLGTQSGADEPADAAAEDAAAPPEDDSEIDSDLEQARADYRDALGRRPYHGWDTAMLRAKIDAHRADAS